MKSALIALTFLLSTLALIAISYPLLKARIDALVVALTVSFAKTYGADVPKALISQYIQDIRKGAVERANQLIIVDRSGVTRFLKLLEHYAKESFTVIIGVITAFMKGNKTTTKTTTKSTTRTTTKSSSTPRYFTAKSKTPKTKYFTPKTSNNAVDLGEVYYESED